jgi:hypothetical protein
MKFHIVYTLIESFLEAVSKVHYHEFELKHNSGKPLGYGFFTTRSYNITFISNILEEDASADTQHKS